MGASNIVTYKRCEYPILIDELLVEKTSPIILWEKYMIGNSYGLKNIDRIRRFKRILNYDECLIEMDKNEIECIFNKIINDL